MLCCLNTLRKSLSFGNINTSFQKKEQSKPNYNSTPYTDRVSEQGGLCWWEKAKEMQTMSLALSTPSLFYASLAL